VAEGRDVAIDKHQGERDYRCGDKAVSDYRRLRMGLTDTFQKQPGVPPYTGFADSNGIPGDGLIRVSWSELGVRHSAAFKVLLNPLRFGCHGTAGNSGDEFCSTVQEGKGAFCFQIPHLKK